MVLAGETLTIAVGGAEALNVVTKVEETTVVLAEGANVVAETGEAAVIVEVGSHVVYQGFDASGNVQYVGITGRTPDVRWLEHGLDASKSSLVDFRVVRGATNLTKTQAGVWEQNLINQYGLPNLLNKINSIAPSKWAQYGVIP